MTQNTFAWRERGGLAGYAAAAILIVAATLIGMAIAPRWGNTAVDLLYILPVIAVAVFAGLRPALLAAVASALAYNYFFTAPFHSLIIHSPADILTVVVLFVVALVTSQLVASVREQARIAAGHAERNATIAGLARRLLSCTSEAEIAEVGVGEIAGLFNCQAAMLVDAARPAILAAAPGDISLTPSDLAAASAVFVTGEASGRGVTRVTTIEWQLLPVRAWDRVIAVAALARDDGVPAVMPAQRELVASLLDQMALALERVRLDLEARDFASLRERDRIRSALVSSIGQDLAPMLESIDGAANTLRRTAQVKEPASAIARESARIQRYLSNLVELGPDSDQKPIEIGNVAIDIFHRTVSRDGKPVHLTPKEYAVLAELAKHPGRVLGHAHLLRAAWGPAQEGHAEYLRVAVRALRQKLERDPKQPRIIINEPAVGYRLGAG